MPDGADAADGSVPSSGGPRYRPSSAHDVAIAELAEEQAAGLGALSVVVPRGADAPFVAVEAANGAFVPPAGHGRITIARAPSRPDR